MSLVLDDRNAALPKYNPLTFGSQPVLNIHANQFGFIQGKPGNTFNRNFHDKFFVPNRKSAGDIFAKPVAPADTIRFRAAEYQSKAAKDAVEALNAVDKERAKQMYFDELDSGNLFPRKGRLVQLPGTVASLINSDGSRTLFHQPGWVRAQQNQFLGDAQGLVERDSDGPARANGKNGQSIIGQNKVLSQFADAATLTDEVGRVGNTSLFGAPTYATQNEFPAHRVRDMRDAAVGTHKLDLDNSTLDLIFANDGKFQVFLDKLRFANTTLQAQLESQNNQLGVFATNTMKALKSILVSAGFDEKTLPDTISPDDVKQLLQKVDAVTPVAIKEVAAMRNMIAAFEAQRFAESVDVGTHYSPPSSPFVQTSSPSHSFTPPIPPPMRAERSVSPDDIFPTRRTPSVSKSPELSPMEINEDPLPQFYPEEAPRFTTKEKGKGPAPKENDIFGGHVVGAQDQEPAVPLRRSTRKTKKPDRYSPK